MAHLSSPYFQLFINEINMFIEPYCCLTDFPVKECISLAMLLIINPFVKNLHIQRLTISLEKGVLKENSVQKNYL